MNKLYHKQLGFPLGLIESVCGDYTLRYSHHARKAALNDRYGVIKHPPVRLIVTPEWVVEIEVTGNRAQKMVCRVPYDGERDLVIVLHPDGFVKTVWFNLRADSHRTLDLSKYDKP